MIRAQALFIIGMVSRAASCLGAGQDWTQEELQSFARQLTQYVLDHHLKKDPNSPQVGMVYEYYDVAKDMWIQGEALDTMHDGAWFANALVLMHGATGDEFYLKPLRQYIMPFYHKVLIHSDELFTDLTGAWSEGKPWPDPRPEKGFCPYWWDDGASVSLEAKRRETGKPAYPATDNLAGQPNPEMRLDGYSHGTSNHMAQDLAVMLGSYWLLTRDEQAALATRYLDESRRRHFGVVHPVAIAAAASNGNAEELAKLADWRGGFEWGEPRGEYYDALFKGVERSAPGFLDGQSYGHHASFLLEQYRSVNAAYAKAFIYNTYTNILLRDLWYDDADPTPGLARFDLASSKLKGGKYEAYHSDQPTAPVGSRMGPMLIWASAVSLQLMNEFPAAWDELTAAQPGDYEVPMLAGDRTDYDPANFGKELATDGTTLRLASTPRKLLILASNGPGKRVEIGVEPLPPAAGQATAITIRENDPVVSARAGEAALIVEQINVTRQDGVSALFAVPYTVAKTQQPWLNAVEEGRLRLRVGDQAWALHFHSSSETVRQTLTRELVEGLRFWQGIFEEWGYIPTGWYPPKTKAGWGDKSDTGGYAHLITAIAEYLNLRAGKPGWKQVQAISTAGR